MQKKSTTYLLALADQKINFNGPKKCRFTLFVRLKAGYISHFNNQSRTWTFRADKYSDKPDKMLKNLINLINNKGFSYDRIVLYDNHAMLDNQVVLKLIDGVVEINCLQNYRELLINFSIPIFLKP